MSRKRKARDIEARSHAFGGKTAKRNHGKKATYGLEAPTSARALQAERFVDRAAHGKSQRPTASTKRKTECQPPMLRAVEQLAGYDFKMPILVAEAFNVPVLTDKGTQPRPEGNKRLARLGDCVFKVAFWDEWFGSSGASDLVGRKLQETTRRRRLAGIGFDKGLGRFVGPESGANREQMPVVMGAIIGAIWLDSGKDIEVVKRVLRSLLGHTLSTK